MQRRSGYSWDTQALVMVCALGCAATLMLLAAGCSGSRNAAQRQGFVRVVTPRPPAFISGAAGFLLTNATGFSAHVDVEAQDSFETGRNSSGQLLGSGTKLLYAPETNEATDTHRRPGGYSFIWDSAESQGYVLSDALQGYAPVSSGLHVTNVALEIGNGAAQRFSGHPCEPASATIHMSNGSSVGFEVLRAIDLNGLPIRIASATNANVFTLSFSKVRVEQIPAAIFSPPDGFTKYPTPEAMADELAVRQSNLKRKNTEPIQPIPGMERTGRY